MRITEVRTYSVAAGPHRNWVLVRILTDEGLEGGGEASLEGKTDTIDVPPNRLEAEKAAALSFIQRQRATTQIGIVAFAGFAELIQLPTSDAEVLQTAVESLIPGSRTAIGSGILKAIDAIAEIDKSVAPSVADDSPEVALTPVPPGAYAPAIIVC